MVWFITELHLTLWRAESKVKSQVETAFWGLRRTIHSQLPFDSWWFANSPWHSWASQPSDPCLPLHVRTLLRCVSVQVSSWLMRTQSYWMGLIGFQSGLLLTILYLQWPFLQIRLHSEVPEVRLQHINLGVTQFSCDTSREFSAS